MVPTVVGRVTLLVQELSSSSPSGDNSLSHSVGSPECFTKNVNIFPCGGGRGGGVEGE